MDSDNLYNKLGSSLGTSSNSNKLFELMLLFKGLSPEEIDKGPDSISDERLSEVGLKRK